MGLKLVLKPHPREKDPTTSNLAGRFDHLFISPDACKTIDLILSSYSVIAGRSTCLTEACLLDRNSAGIVPDISDEELVGFPPLSEKAIPYTQKWDEISSIISLVSSESEADLKQLAERRKRFSVDGKASQCLADLVEEVFNFYR